MDMRATPRRAALPAGARAHPLVLPEPLLDAWLDLMPPRQAATTRAVHDAVMAAAPLLVPSLKWGNLLYLNNGRPFLSLTPHRLSTQLQLVHAAAGPRRAPARVLRGPDPRTLRFRHSQRIEHAALVDVLRNVLRPFVSPRA